MLTCNILDTPWTTLDNALDFLCDNAKLCTTSERLSLVSKDKKVDILFCVQIMSMVGMLNLFLHGGRQQ
jgi:hypothetical protein